MGTKKQLAPTVANLARAARSGPFLDLFSGMCAVGATVSKDRQIWSNDLQVFAYSVANAHFCFLSMPPTREDVVSKLRPPLSRVREQKYRESYDRLTQEDRALKSGHPAGLADLYAKWTSADVEARESSSHDLFERSFSGSFFGLEQAIEIDAIRQVIDVAVDEKTLSEDGRTWLLLALAVAIGQCGTVTGHFAQSLRPNERNIRRFISQRKKGIVEHWLNAVEKLTPFRDASWRGRNHAFRSDALSLLSSMESQGASRPSVIYADPPYTADHYSRFYHVYETLMLYDHPAARGRGRYRDDRVPSAFSIKTSVEYSLRELIQTTAKLGSTLILSYPTNGLLENSRDSIPKMIFEAFGAEPDVLEIEHRHSTMGASKGSGKANVTEVLYHARAA